MRSLRQLRRAIWQAGACSAAPTSSSSASCSSSYSALTAFEASRGRYDQTQQQPAGFGWWQHPRQRHFSAAAAAGDTSAATASAAPPAPSEPSKAASSKKAKGKAGQPQAKGGTDAKQAQVAAVPSVDELRAGYQRSRLRDFYMSTLSRELLLKLNLKSVRELPTLRSVSVAIQAKDVQKQQHVDKWQMLLYALGLEYMSARPAQYATSRLKYYRDRNAVAGVYVKLHGAEAYDFLEKLTYLVLPSQNAFEGILTRSLDRAGHLHFRVSRMANFPDYEEMFETFEELGGMHVSIVMDNVARRPERTQLLLTGLQLPVFAKRIKMSGKDEEEEEGAEQQLQGQANAPAAAA